MIEFRVHGGVERATHGGPRIQFETPEQRMVAMGCPRELADGSMFERLAAEKRSGVNVPSVVPAGLREKAAATTNTVDASVDEYHRKRAAEIAKEL